MASDYDLIVIGNNRAARWAAIAAAGQSARVVLVAPEPESIPMALLLRTWTIKQLSTGSLSPHQYGFKAWATAWAEQAMAARSPIQLASLGIEQIDGLPQFLANFQGVRVGDRILKARRYLLALDATPTTPPGAGLLTPAQLLQQLDPSQPSLASPVVILGDGPTAVSLSQSLARLHHQVTILSSHSQLLPGEDPDTAFGLQAHLEADGVNILTHFDFGNIHALADQGQALKTPQGTVRATTLLWVPEPSITTWPWLPDLLRYSRQGLWVNAKLQTSQPQIYACGSVLGGYTLPDLAEYEAKVALSHALGTAPVQLNYHCQPWVVWTDPPWARVGLTEAQARAIKGEIEVLQVPYQNLEPSQLDGHFDGWCKFILDPRGQLLGAQMMGTAAAETIQLIARVIRQQGKISDLAEQTYIAASYGSILAQMLDEWHRLHPQRPSRLFGFRP